MERYYEVLRIIEKGLQHNDEGLKSYARRLAEKLKGEDEEFSKLILGSIGDIELPMATMDSNINNDETRGVVEEILGEDTRKEIESTVAEIHKLVMSIYKKGVHDGIDICKKLRIKGENNPD